MRKTGDVEQAMRLFLEAIQVDSDKVSALIGYADCLKCKGEYKSANEYYGRCFDKNPRLRATIGIKRADCYLELSEFEKAEGDINYVRKSSSKALSANTSNPINIYYSAKLMRKRGDIKSAEISYENCISISTNQQISINCIRELILIRLEAKDFYGAHHIISRLETIPQDLAEVCNFIEGIISIIKKKYSEGMQRLVRYESRNKNLDSHNENNTEIFSYFDGIINSFRAFCYIQENKLTEAFQIYDKLKVGGKATSGDLYNLELCKGVIASRAQDYNWAKICFEAANDIEIPNAISPAYLAIVEVTSRYNEFLSKEKWPILEVLNEETCKSAICYTLREIIIHSINVLDILSQDSDSSSDLCYLSGLLKLSIGQARDAVLSFSDAIEKSDDPIALQYLYRGIALSILNQYEEAIVDFKAALNLSPDNYLLGLMKGRCYLNLKDVERAYTAFYDFLDEGEQEAEIKYWIASFFFKSGFRDHAITLYSHALKCNDSENTWRQLYFCFINEKNLLKGYETLNEINEKYPSKEYRFDLKLLEALKLSTTEMYEESMAIFDSLSQDHIKLKAKGCAFTEADFLFFKGICSVFVGRFEEALSHLQTSKKRKYGDVLPNQINEDNKLKKLLYLEKEDEMSECQESLQNEIDDTFLYPEIVYNIALVELFLEMKDEAIRRLRLLIIDFPIIADRVRFVLDILSSNDSSTPPSPICLLPFQNRFCGVYNPIEYENEAKVPKHLLFSFCIGNIRPPDIGIKIGVEVLEKVSPELISFRAEAPWAKNEKRDQMFTNSLTQSGIKEFDNEDEIFQNLLEKNQFKRV